MSSVSSEAAAKLRGKGWRRKASWWVWVPLITFGMFGWVGFLVAGIRFRERRYWLATAASGVGAALIFLFIGLDNERDTWLADVGTVIALIVAIGCAIAAGIWNKEYLVKMAERDVSGFSTPTHSLAPSTQQTRAGFLGVDNRDFYAAGQAPAAPSPATHSSAPASTNQPPVPTPASTPPPTSGAPASASLDINAATADQLTAHLGVSTDIARRVVEARGSGRFADFDDLAKQTDLPPHELVRFRGRVAFGSAPQPPQNRPSGRVLDL